MPDTIAAAGAAAGSAVASDKDPNAGAVAGAAAGTSAADAAKAAAGSASDAGAAAGSGDGKGAAGAGAGDTTWRDRLAGGDKDFRTRLDRFTDEGSFAKSYRELETKLSSGQYKPVAEFPANGTDEEKAAWRKDRGVPDSPDGYKVELPNGVVMGEADKPILSDFAKAAHAKNWDPKTYNEAVEWYYKHVDESATARQAADDGFTADSTVSLKDEWGKDYNRNVQAVRNLLSKAPADVADRFTGGRTADGKLIGSDPAILKWLAQTALDLDPMATVMPAGKADIASLTGRKTEIKAMMGDQTSDYWRGPKATALQKEYLDIVSAEERMNARK